MVHNFDETLRIDIGIDASRMERTRVVIVGAGIAGLAAAKTLQDAGFADYLLLEAQNKIGGRICSVSIDNGWIDLGAQFLHGDRSKLAQYCLSNNLLSNMQGTDGEGLFLRDDGTTMSESLVREIDDLVRSVLEECYNYRDKKHQTDVRRIPEKDQSIGSILRNRFEEYLRKRNDTSLEREMKEEIFDWNVRFLLVDNSCDSLDDLSMTMWGKFEYAGGPDYLLFKSSYSSVTNLLLDNLNQKNLRLNTSVESIRWRDSIVSRENSPIIVTTSEGTRILAEAVIVTCSLGYLKERHGEMFQPPLPDRLRVAIEDLGFGSINKIILDFGERAWWQTGAKGFHLLRRRNVNQDFLPEWTRDLTGFDVSANHPATLVGWIAGQGARIVENLSEETIAQDCVNLLTHYLKRHDIPPVKRCFRTNWNGNKYVRGGYSHITKSCETDNVSPRTLAEPVWAIMSRNGAKKNVPIIMFAGEATHDHFYSTTHGAYETGIQQAEVFLHHSDDM